MVANAYTEQLCTVRFWWIRIKALAERRDWNELEKFSKSKKSPIGYEVFKSMYMI